MFGGGYPQGYECAVNIPRMIIENINRNANENVIGRHDEEIYMIKYNE
ncbi:MAG: hypothetical protein GX941_09685 [Candidatus Methanofastidiosa archaeon]|nr:hypothetical protein [Candidatus Methanofastidiosa archaeon]